MAKVLHTWIADLPLDMVRGSGEVLLDDLTDDSRQILDDGRRWAFLVRDGAGGLGERFIEDALARGAAAIVGGLGPTAEQARQYPDAAWVVSTGGGAAGSGALPTALVGALAEGFFDRPAEKLALIGITGTNGKTTTAHLVHSMLNRLGARCGLIGTVEIDDGATRQPATLTTPGAIDLSRLLKRMVDQGCIAAAMEVSSHALDQGRAAALRFDVGVFTNLTGDHLDYHGTMDAYAAAKAKLFERSAAAVVNADDPFSERMVEHFDGPVIWCRVRGPGEADDTASDADRKRTVVASIEALTAESSRFRLEGVMGERDVVTLGLAGKHNMINAIEALAAVGEVIRKVGCDDGWEDLIEVLERCEAVPGRLERVAGSGVDGLPVVLVDYAHTDDALANVLRAARGVTSGRLIVVVGCGGDRDRTKRPRMARVAYELADEVVITSDNPRTEDPQRIIADMCAGLPTNGLDKRVVIEADRARAIAIAVERGGLGGHGGDGDTVVIAGKGHEDYQIIGTQKRPFDDRVQAAAALERLATRTEPQRQPQPQRDGD